MEPPSWTAMKQARLDSEACYELEMITPQASHPELALKKGDRVFLLTIEGEFPSHVVEDWSGHNLLEGVKATVDCDRGSDWVRFHRDSWRAFSALDLLADV